MKVAINAWFWDQPSVGSGQYLKYLAPALLELDNQLQIILISPKPTALPEQTLSKNLRIQPAQTPFSNPASHLSKVWFEQITFPRLCRRLGVDVAHIPYFGSPWATSGPTVVTIHDLIPMILPEYRGDLRARLYTALVAAAAPRASLILADSQATRRDILARLKVSGDRVRVVYLAPAPHYRVDETCQQRAKIKTKYKLPEQFVLYSGGYHARKNVATLLHAYASLDVAFREQYPLVLSGRLPKNGSGVLTNPMAQVRQLGIEKQVVTPGWVAEEDLPFLYAAATVFVYPSRYEGFGLPVLEAMACGTPVVTSSVSSLPELAGSAARQIDPDDKTALAEAIVRLCTDEATASTIVETGFDQVKKFTWAKTAAETLAAYRAVGTSEAS